MLSKLEGLAALRSLGKARSARGVFFSIPFWDSGAASVRSAWKSRGTGWDPALPAVLVEGGGFSMLVLEYPVSDLDQIGRVRSLLWERLRMRTAK